MDTCVFPGAINRAPAAMIVGLDIGSHSSGIAMYNTQTGRPELIDVSGGYGKPVCPTAAQYIPDTDEWVFGEYAVLGGTDTNPAITGFADKLGEQAHITASGKSHPVSYVLGLFIKELVKNCEALDPQAEIVGIAVSVPDYFSNEAEIELRQAFSYAGLDNIPLFFVQQTVCVMTHILRAAGVDIKHAAILDYGQGAARGGVYEIDNSDEETALNLLSYQEDTAIGSDAIDAAVYGLFEQIYTAQTGAKPDGQLFTFAYQNKEPLFRRGGSGSSKLYFNFCSPPFAHTVTKEETDALTEPLREGLTRFLDDLIPGETASSPAPQILSPGARASCPHIKVDTVILTGGGFDMPQMKAVITERFPNARIIDKQPKALPALGAALIAAGSLGAAEIKPIRITDTQVSAEDYGIMAETPDGERFIPLIERGARADAEPYSHRVLINREHTGTIPLTVYKRGADGEITPIAETELNGLPIRPKGAGFFDITMRYADNGNITLCIEDAGFGQFFEKTGYSAQAEIKPIE